MQLKLCPCRSGKDVNVAGGEAFMSFCKPYERTEALISLVVGDLSGP